MFVPDSPEVCDGQRDVGGAGNRKGLAVVLHQYKATPLRGGAAAGTAVHCSGSFTPFIYPPYAFAFACVLGSQMQVKHGQQAAECVTGVQ